METVPPPDTGQKHPVPPKRRQTDMVCNSFLNTISQSGSVAVARITIQSINELVKKG